MFEGKDSKEFSRKWITASELLSKVACELLFALAISDGNAMADNLIYNGEDTAGELIVNLQSGIKESLPFTPSVPVYCSKGLYVVIGSNTEGIFVQWRERPSKEG